MTTWAQRKRHEFIRERIKDGARLNRSDLVEQFTISKQTASATLHQFEALYPGVIAYDQRTKSFVRADLVATQPCRPTQRWLWRVRSLLASIRDVGPDDIVADGVTVAMVWAQEAAELLGDGDAKLSSSADADEARNTNPDPGAK